MPQLKILSLSHYPSWFVQDMCHYLRKHGAEVEEFYPQHKTIGTGAGLLKNKRYLKTPKLSMIWYAVRNACVIFWKTRSADILYAHWSLPSGLIAAVVGRLLHKPCVITEHGGAVYNNPAAGFYAPTLWYVRILLRLTFKLVSKVVAISEDTRQHLINAGCPAGKIIIIYNGCNTDLYDPFKTEIIPIYNITPYWPLLVSVSMLKERKGVQDILQALVLLRKEYPDILLAIVGDGEYKPRLFELCDSYELSRNVIFLGKQEPKELPGIIAQATICIKPSWEEGFCISAAEMMAMQRPLIATQAGGLREVVNADVAEIIPPQSPIAIAKAVGYLLENPDVSERKAKAGRDWVLQKFSWDRAMGEYLKVFATEIQKSIGFPSLGGAFEYRGGR